MKLDQSLLLVHFGNGITQPEWYVRFCHLHNKISYTWRVACLSVTIIMNQTDIRIKISSQSAIVVGQMDSIDWQEMILGIYSIHMFLLDVKCYNKTITNVLPSKGFNFLQFIIFQGPTKVDITKKGEVNTYLYFIIPIRCYDHD